MSISNFSLWRLFFAIIKRRYLQIFQNKIFIFKAPLILWKLKLCCPCDWCMWLKLPIFWNWTSKNITDRQQCVGFQKSKKVLNHSTLVGTLLYKFCDGNDFGFAKLVFILTPFSCIELCVIVACHVLFTKSVKLPNTIQEVGGGSLTSLWAGNSPAEILIKVKLFQGKRIDQILLLYF